jgi:hypothetical protein
MTNLRRVAECFMASFCPVEKRADMYTRGRTRMSVALVARARDVRCWRPEPLNDPPLVARLARQAGLIVEKA